MAPNPKRPSPQETHPDEKRARSERPQSRDMVKTQERVPPTTSSADREMQVKYSASHGEHQPAFLYVERGPGLGQLLEVTEGMLIVGRASVSDLRLQHPSISRRHSQIRRVGEQFFVKDLGSQNGTFVNGARVGTELEVKAGDAIALGNALLRLRGPLTKSEKLSQRSVTPMPRAKEPKANISTALVMRPPAAMFQSKPSGVSRKQRTAFKIGTVAAAGGFAVAALLSFAMVKIVSPGASDKAAVTQEKIERATIIDAAIKRQPEAPTHAKDSDTVQEQVLIEPEAPIIRAKEQPKPPSVTVAAASPVKPSPSARKPSAAPKEKEGDEGETNHNRTQILAPYERGNAEASLELAHKAGDKELTDKLSRFITTYDAANDAMMVNNGSAAITNFQKALALDEGLSSGWGKYGAEIRRQLSNLYVLVGLQFITTGDIEKAKAAFSGALKHDSNNVRAKQQLAKLSADVPKSIDDAFEEGTKQTAKKTGPPQGSIDDAFGE